MKADPAVPAQSGIHRITAGPHRMSIADRRRQNGFCVEKSRALRWQVHGAT
jgi:hypothetical protein